MLRSRYLSVIAWKRAGVMLVSAGRRGQSWSFFELVLAKKGRTDPLSNAATNCAETPHYHIAHISSPHPSVKSFCKTAGNTPDCLFAAHPWTSPNSRRPEYPRHR